MAKDIDELIKNTEELAKNGKVSAEYLKKFKEDAEEVKDHMSGVANLGADIVKKFKDLNGLTGTQVASLSTIRQFNKEILGDEQARRLALDAQDDAINKAEKELLEARLGQFELTKDQVAVSEALLKNAAEREEAEKRLNELKSVSSAVSQAAMEAALRQGEAESRNVAALQERKDLEKTIAAERKRLSKFSSTDAEEIGKHIIELGKLESMEQRLVEVKQEQKDAAKEAKEQGKLFTKYSKEAATLAKEQESAQSQFNDLAEEGTRLKGLEVVYMGQADAAREAALRKAQDALKAEQALKKELVRSAGYMNYMKDQQYEMLGPAAGMVNNFKKFSADSKVIPVPFMVLSKLISEGINRFMALDQAAEDFRKETGYTNVQMVDLRKNAESVNKQLQEFGVSIKEAYQAAGALADAFGSINLVSKEAMENVALMSANLGVSVKDSAEVLTLFQGLGGASEQASMNVMEMGARLSGKAGVPFSKVMNDIANASDQTLSLLSANPSKLMKAAIAARTLGTDMNKLVSSQRKLLDFESSMNDELQLSALLGKSVSFQRARQLAYQGDTLGAAKATLDVVRKAGDFDKMSVYQREQLAKASGMELKDLTKMMAVDKKRREIEMSGTPEQKEKLRMQDEALKKLEEEADLSKQSLVDQQESEIRQKRMQGLMTNMKNLLETITLALGDVLEPMITPLVKILVPALKVVVGLVKLLLWPFKALSESIVYLGTAASDTFSKFEWVKSIANWFSGASTSVGKFYDEYKAAFTAIGALAGGILTLVFFGKGGFTKLMSMVKAPFKLAGSLKNTIMSKITGKGVAGEAAANLAKPTEQMAGAAKATKDVPSGTGIKDFLKNLAEGLREMGSGKVLFGALNLIPASIGLVAMIPGAAGAYLLSKIKGEDLKTSLQGLAAGLESMGTGKVLFGAVNMLLASPGLIAIAPGALLIGAVGAFGKLLEDGLKYLAKGLSYMGDTSVFKGALGIAAVGLSIVPFALAMMMFTEVDWAKATIGLGVLTVMAGVAALLSFAAPFIISGSVAIGILGLSLIPFGIAAMAAGVGMQLLSKGVEAMIDPIKRISEIELAKTAFGIGLVSASLVALGVASLGASFAAVALTGLSVALGLFGIAAMVSGKGIQLLANGIESIIDPIKRISETNFVKTAFGIGLFTASLAAFGVVSLGLPVATISLTAFSVALGLFGISTIVAGKGITMMADGLKSSLDPIERLSKIDLTKTALGIGAVGAALAAFGAGSAASGLGSFVGNLLGGDPIAKMEKLASMGEKLKMTAESIGAIANATSQFKAMDAFTDSIDKLTTSLGKLNDQISNMSMIKLAALTAITAASAAAASAASATATGTTAGAAPAGTSGVEAKLDRLTDLLVGGAIRVYVDGKDVSSALSATGR